MSAKRQRMSAERQRMSAERQRMSAERQRKLGCKNAGECFAKVMKNCPRAGSLPKHQSNRNLCCFQPNLRGCTKWLKEMNRKKKF